jgi:hypothetical protein
MSINALQYSLIHSLDSESQGYIPTMLAVHTLRPEDYLSAAARVDESLVCISALTGARFQIRLMPRLTRDQQIRFAYLAQAVEMGCGWHTVVFAEHPTSPPCSFLIDHQRRILFVGVKVLRQSHEVVLNLSRHVVEYLKRAFGGPNLGCGGFFVSGNATRLFIGQTASITLILDPENGLRFPSFVALSTDELTVHVATAGDEIYIRSAVWRLFHKTFEPLPCYSYQVGVVSDADSHIIPLPMQLLCTLRRVPKLTFSVNAI